MVRADPIGMSDASRFTRAGGGFGERRMCMKGMRREEDARIVPFIRTCSTYHDLKLGRIEDKIGI
jgi:hypothetical protein